MYGKTRNVKMQKLNNSRCGKSGFTLVELSIVMTLLVIVTAMIVSFSVLMNKFSSQSKAEYDFLEEYATLKEELSTWIAENDISGAEFVITMNGQILSVDDHGNQAYFANEVLTLGTPGEGHNTAFEQIKEIRFNKNDKLIKCSVTSQTRNGFSLVEVVIALSIIVIVSAAALSIIFSSIATRANAVNKTRAINFADNVWECFKAADDEDQFTSFVKFSEGIDLDGMGTYFYISEENNFTARIYVDFDTDRDEFEIEVFDQDGEEIISFDYTKGVEK